MKKSKPTIDVNSDDSAQDIIGIVRRGLLNKRRIIDAKTFDAETLTVSDISRKAVMTLARKYANVIVNVVEVAEVATEDSP